MTTQAERNLQHAHALLEWNRAHLRHDTVLTEAVIAERFAPQFTVFANGRHYDANYANYKTFLDGFKHAIASIDYKVTQTVADAAGVVLGMRASVTRTHGAVDQFEAMLLLRFDDAGKVSLWHEVYLQSPHAAG
ncbi:hypothetical protein ACS15_3757 [Ralstonia insidiosa]|jgi:hypothetical protein|uniref:SnoaL-like domain-containing protein n=1 Tax=Ralstonia insidiosa TaxID=190721 RepID=A0AAC9FQL2_9RALS|nr:MULTISPECIES: hypothetical protein [Ralstonia]ANH72767.1 hypothetical protein ACS15_3757 [Ralstonia insidiosa]EPX95387.1 hypothetical protein C404_23680 [Ralstonia sp. AU12-08]MBY4708019.1 nuclear transport factor 2 family protein [Ralstonia insidiosa]GAQ28644.1 hypothetical protein SAMD00023378_2327 [Ralstonia sp. NT80]